MLQAPKIQLLVTSQSFILKRERVDHKKALVLSSCAAPAESEKLLARRDKEVLFDEERFLPKT